MRRRLARLAAFAAVALVAGGCGADDIGQDPNRNRAVDRCLDEARKVQDSSARRTAEESCRSARSGDAARARQAAKQQCLDQVRRVPDAAARRQAREACERIG